MSARSLMRRGLASLKHPDIGPPKGWGGVVEDAAVGFGVSYALGQAHIQYRDSDSFLAKHLAEVVAVVGKLGGILLGSGYAGAAVNAAGQAGVNAIGLDLGIDHAMKRQGRQVAITPPGVSFDPAKLPAGTRASTVLGSASRSGQEVLGDIPQADPKARWLSRADCDRIAAMR